MLWRLFNSGNGVERYKHGDNPAWALVTGSSDGIGREVAAELVSRGFNVFIHGRNHEKLAKVKDEISKPFPDRSVEIIVADSSDSSPSNIENIVHQLEGHNLTVLMNNVAWTGGKFESLQDMEYEEVEKAVNMNIRFFTHLTRALLPVLSRREPALIINSSSLVARYPMGYLSIYAASKAYMVGLSRGLVHELAAESRNIQVMVIEIHNSQSAGNTSSRSWHTPDAKTMAAAIVNSVGKAGSNVVITPYWGHELMGSFLWMMGTWRLGKIGTEKVVEQYGKKG